MLELGRGWGDWRAGGRVGCWQGGAGVQGPKAAGEGLEEPEDTDKGIQRLLRAGSPGIGPDESFTPC